MFPCIVEDAMCFGKRMQTLLELACTRLNAQVCMFNSLKLSSLAGLHAACMGIRQRTHAKPDLIVGTRTAESGPRTGLYVPKP